MHSSVQRFLKKVFTLATKIYLLHFIFLCIELKIKIKKIFKCSLTDLILYCAVVAELVDARVLGTRILGCGSSSLPDRIKVLILIDIEIKLN